MTSTAALERILDLARWAPSGDNDQPWRFELAGNDHVVVHGRDTRDRCVYDLQGRATQLALGALLETLTIAASGEGLTTTVSRRADTPDNQPSFDVSFAEAPKRDGDALLPFIRLRCTQRRALHTRPLTAHERNTLEASLPSGYHVRWLEGAARKLQMARLLFANAGIRLAIPEAYETHRRVIRWRARYSDEGIPDQAVGLDPLTTRLMEWTLRSWPRVRFMNRYLAGTLLPRLQLDVVPALACAAHFMIISDRDLRAVDDYVNGGRALQRFWLSASALGLQLQPEMTPLIFTSYVRQGIAFTRDAERLADARRLAADLDQLFAADTRLRAVFMGRIGAGPAPTTRSYRKPLAELLKR